MRKIVLAVVASLAVSTGAVAQAAPAIDTATATAVNELLVSMRYEEVMKATMQAVTVQMPSTILQRATAAINRNPQLTAEQKTAEIERVKRGIPQIAETMNQLINDPELMKELVAEMTPLYARHFTLEEIRQMTALYRTPLGAKMLRVMPAAVSESTEIAKKVMFPRIQMKMQQLQAK
jgi:hypothetical protein